MSRPNFLTSPGSWLRAPRVNESRADYASPITVYRHEHSWRVSDAVIVVILVGVIAAFALGVL